MLVGMLATRAFKLPAWVTPALCFNNTTSLPLLLIQSLSSTGILDSILAGNGDTSSAAIDRAKSYFLINSMVSNSLTFALGPRLLRPYEEDTPESWQDGNDGVEQTHPGGSNGDPYIQQEEDVENAPMAVPGSSTQPEDEGHDSAGSDVEQRAAVKARRNGTSQEEARQEVVDEETTLLPVSWVRTGHKAGREANKEGEQWWNRFPSWVQSTLEVLYAFVNPPLIGALLGALIGLVPSLHRLFFAESNEGGYLNAWLTSSISNVGGLFASIQIIVVGVKLSQSLRKMKKGEESGAVPWRSMTFITVVRFFIWPAISIPIIWALATKTTWLSEDPILWFAMMLMPCGPPAMILVSLSDVNGSDEKEKMAIAKLLTISYAITPLICLAVVGSLKASEAAIGV